MSIHLRIFSLKYLIYYSRIDSILQNKAQTTNPYRDLDATRIRRHGWKVWGKKVGHLPPFCSSLRRPGDAASILGQGDNQVILLRVPPEDYLHSPQLTQDQYIENYLRVLRNMCDQAKIVVKLEETWYSRHLFEYSRRYHYRGIQVSGCCKRITSG